MAKPPISMITSLEKAARNTYASQLPLLIELYGYPCIWKRQPKTAETDFYGRQAGTPRDTKLQNLGPQKVLMSNSQWRVVSGAESGYFDDIGFMYVKFDLLEGDVLEIERDNMKNILIRAISAESLGVSTSILKRFTISNLGAD